MNWFNGERSWKWVQGESHPPLAEEPQFPRDFSDYGNDSLLFGKKISIDYNHSKEKEFLRFLQQANPQNDWIVSTNDPVVAKLIENPEALGLKVIDELSDLGAIRLRIVITMQLIPVYLA